MHHQVFNITLTFTKSQTKGLCYANPDIISLLNKSQLDISLPEGHLTKIYLTKSISKEIADPDDDYTYILDEILHHSFKYTLRLTSNGKSSDKEFILSKLVDIPNIAKIIISDNLNSEDSSIDYIPNISTYSYIKLITNSKTIPNKRWIVPKIPGLRSCTLLDMDKSSITNKTICSCRQLSDKFHILVTDIENYYGPCIGYSDMKDLLCLDDLKCYYKVPKNISSKDKLISVNLECKSQPGKIINCIVDGITGMRLASSGLGNSLNNRNNQSNQYNQNNQSNQNNDNTHSSTSNIKVKHGKYNTLDEISIRNFFEFTSDKSSTIKVDINLINILEKPQYYEYYYEYVDNLGPFVSDRNLNLSNIDNSISAKPKSIKCFGDMVYDDIVTSSDPRHPSNSNCQNIQNIQSNQSNRINWVYLELGLCGSKLRNLKCIVPDYCLNNIQVGTIIENLTNTNNQIIWPNVAVTKMHRITNSGNNYSNSPNIKDYFNSIPMINGCYFGL